MKIEKTVSAKFWKEWILKNFLELSCWPALLWMNSSSTPQPCSGKQTEKHFQEVSRTVTPLPAGVSVALCWVWEAFQHKTENSCCPVQLDHERVLAAVVSQGAGVKASLQENMSEEEPRPQFGTVTSRRYLKTICEWPAGFTSPVVRYIQLEWSFWRSSEQCWV